MKGYFTKHPVIWFFDVPGYQIWSSPNYPLGYLGGTISSKSVESMPRNEFHHVPFNLISQYYDYNIQNLISQQHG